MRILTFNRVKSIFLAAHVKKGQRGQVGVRGWVKGMPPGNMDRLEVGREAGKELG